jgi:predicted XRE-type DNA-binding protein
VKHLLFLGTAREDLTAFPYKARRKAGQQFQGAVRGEHWRRGSCAALLSKEVIADLASRDLARVNSLQSVSEQEQAMNLRVERFESVWDAIEDSPEMAREMERRSGMMIALQEHIRHQGWTKQEAAQRLDASEDRIVMLLDGDIDSFSEASLLSMCKASGLAPN